MTVIKEKSTNLSVVEKDGFGLLFIKSSKYSMSAQNNFTSYQYYTEKTE